MTDRIHTPIERAGATAASRRRLTGAHPLVGLQRAAGNRAVQRLLAREPAALDGEEISLRIGAAEGGGSALDARLRQRLGDALGADPGDVRVHTDGEADDLSRSLGAKAFTSGRDIFFRDGTFDPSSPEGFELLVHESTHVLQQAEGPVPGTETADGALAISDPGDPFERAATSNAEAPAVAPISASESRPVQRFGLDDLIGTAEQSQQGPGPLGGMLGSFGSAIGDDASSGNLGMGTLQKAAMAEEAREKQQGADIRSSQKSFESGVDSASGWLGSTAKSLAKDSGTGAFGEGIANTVDQAGRFTGGFAKEVWGMGAGLDSIVQNPLGFQKAQSARAEKEAVPMATNQYFDSLGKISRGEEGLGDAAGEIFGAFTKGKDNELEAKKAAAQPAINDINKGDYAGALGHLGAQVGVAVLGMGEEGPLGEVGAEAAATGDEGLAASQTAKEGGVVANEAGEISPAARSVPAPGGQLEPPISPAAESVPTPPGQLEPPISPAAESVPTPPGQLEPPISPAAESLPEGIPDTQPGLPPTERGLPPTERGLPPTEREIPPTEPGAPPTLRDPPRTIPGLGDPESPLTLPGLGPEEGPGTLPGLGAPEGPSTLPGVAPDPNPLPELAPQEGPSTLPGVAPDPNLPPPTLRSPEGLQGELVPEISPKAESLREPPGPDPLPSPNPDPSLPATQRSPGTPEPVRETPAEAPISEAPATPGPDEIGRIRDEFEQAWGQFSKEPFDYGSLPGFN